MSLLTAGEIGTAHHVWSLRARRYFNRYPLTGCASDGISETRMNKRRVDEICGNLLRPFDVTIKGKRRCREGARAVLANSDDQGSAINCETREILSGVFSRTRCVPDDGFSINVVILNDVSIVNCDQDLRFGRRLPHTVSLSGRAPAIAAPIGG